MSDNNQAILEMATKPINEHQWLQNLVGEWRTESEMSMEPGGNTFKSKGKASVKSLGGLWAFSENTETMPDGNQFESYFALGYDVSFKEYRGCYIISASSHLWNYIGHLSADGRIMSLDCEGPSMTDDGKTAMYRDVIELIDNDHRTTTSSVQDKNGQWQVFGKSDFYRI